jgi:hypothetical protein
MYITDLKHFLDSQGALGPAKGPARAMAQFQTDVVACATCATCATDTTDAAPEAPTCFKCKKSAVEAALARDEAVVWKCTFACDARRPHPFRFVRHRAG